MEATPRSVQSTLPPPLPRHRSKSGGTRRPALAGDGSGGRDGGLTCRSLPAVPGSLDSRPPSLSSQSQSRPSGLWRRLPPSPQPPRSGVFRHMRSSAIVENPAEYFRVGENSNSLFLSGAEQDRAADGPGRVDSGGTAGTLWPPADRHRSYRADRNRPHQSRPLHHTTYRNWVCYTANRHRRLCLLWSEQYGTARRYWSEIIITYQDLPSGYTAGTEV